MLNDPNDIPKESGKTFGSLSNGASCSPLPLLQYPTSLCGRAPPRSSVCALAPAAQPPYWLWFYLLDAAERTRALLFSDQLRRLVVGRGEDDLQSVRPANVLPNLSLSLLVGTSAVPQSIATEATLPLGSRDEAYSLVVPADGSGAVLSANSTLGLFRGLTTFGQLWYMAGGTVYTLSAPVVIHDSPAYPYRGFMLDTARNYFPVSDIKRTLDACSWVHINTFHWHVVDSQSFPLVIPGFTDIAEKGAYSAFAVYTPEDVADILSYAGAVRSTCLTPIL